AAWLDPATPRELEITARVATRDRTEYCPDASPKELAEYLRPTPSSPTDGIVLAKSREIVGSRTVALDKARAIYDRLSTTRSDAQTRVGAVWSISRLCWRVATWAVNAPTSTRCMSGWRGQPGCRRETSSISALPTRPCRNRSENRAKLPRHSIAAPRCL